MRDAFKKGEKQEERGPKKWGSSVRLSAMAVMGFLTPFIADRETASNMPRHTPPPPPCTSLPETPGPVSEENKVTQDSSQQASVSLGRRETEQEERGDPDEEEEKRE